MQETSETETLNGVALLQLRKDIVSGVYQPGENLRMEKLKQRYDMGASPLREALSRLTTEGLVTAEANRGFRVAQTSKTDLADVTLVRQTIEACAVERAIELGGDDWEVGVVAALRRLTLVAKKSYESPEARLEVLDEAHWQFHRAVLSGCESPRLLELQESLYRQGARYRNIMLNGSVDADVFVASHEALTEVLLQRDVARAQDALRNHIARTAEEVFGS